MEELKRVFEEVLRFEKTPCPFQRNFTVELPKAPETPIKRKPWRPVERPKLESASSSTEDLRTPSRSLSCSPTWGPRGSKSRSPSPLSALGEDTASVTSEIGSQSFDQDIDRPIETRTNLEPETIKSSADVANDTSLKPSLLEDSIVESVFEDFSGIEDDTDTLSDTTEDKNITPRGHAQPALQTVVCEAKKGDKLQALQLGSRSITAPPVLSLVTSPPSRHRTRSISPLRSANSLEMDSAFSSSVESFHSVQSWHSPLDPPSPYASGRSSPSSTFPYPHEEIALPKRLDHSREVSEITVTPETPRLGRIATISEVESSARASSPQPQTPTLSHDGSEKSDEEQFEVLTPPTIRPAIRHRATTSSNSRRRALSPLPPAVNLFSPPRRNNRRLKTARHLPTAIIQKTCEILLSPPSHLFRLMISIATKIAAGEWRGVLSGEGESVHWDFEDEYGGDTWEDDYGISLPKPHTTAKSTNSNATGGSWEVD